MFLATNINVPRKTVNNQSRNMTDYKKFPPFNYFLRVLKSCPRSALLYSQLWKERNKNNKLEVEKDRIRRNFLMSHTIFRNLIQPLVSIEIISYDENDNCYIINFNGVADE